MNWLHTLWFHYGWPSCQGNGPEAVIEILILAALGRLLWPVIKREIHSGEEELHRKLDLLHQKADHIIEHHCPPFEEK